MSLLHKEMESVCGHLSENEAGPMKEAMASLQLAEGWLSEKATDQAKMSFLHKNGKVAWDMLARWDNANPVRALQILSQNGGFELKEAEVDDLMQAIELALKAPEDAIRCMLHPVIDKLLTLARQFQKVTEMLSKDDPPSKAAQKKKSTGKEEGSESNPANWRLSLWLSLLEELLP